MPDVTVPVPSLVSVADGAYPQDNYDFLPPTVTWWLGYVGGETPHAWTYDERMRLEDTGRTWGGIWTAPQSGPYTRGQAQADAAGMIAGLTRLRYPTGRPVFLDVERSVWAANPAQTDDAADYWRVIMHESGWAPSAWYGPVGSGCGWLADWTGVPPVTLPAGLVGIQYDHALAGDRYDISRFDSRFLSGGNVSVTGPENWDANDWQAFRSAVAETGLNTGTQLLDAVRAADTQTVGVLAAVEALSAKVDKIVTAQGPAKYTTGGPITFVPGT